jgi:predicted secreted protein
MSITAALVLFAVTWCMLFFIILPLRLTTQGDAGDVVPGTHASSPAGFVVARKARLTTFIAIPLWGLLIAAILFSGIGVRDIDWFGRMGENFTPAVVD